MQFNFKENMFQLNLSRVHLLKTIYSAVMQQLIQKLSALNIVSERKKKCRANVSLQMGESDIASE